MNHSATSGLACWKGLCRFGTLYVCGVCRFGPDDPLLRRPLSSPWLPHLSDYSGCTIHFGCPPLAGPRRVLWRRTFCSTVGWNKKNKKLTSTFGITVTLVCQEYTNMRTERKWFTLVDMDCEYKQKTVSFFQLLFNSPILKPCVFSMNS